MSQTEKTTDEEIEKIDETLKALDALLKTLPTDYQTDWVFEKAYDLGYWCQARKGD